MISVSSEEIGMKVATVKKVDDMALVRIKNRAQITLPPEVRKASYEHRGARSIPGAGAGKSAGACKVFSPSTMSESATETLTTHKPEEWQVAEITRALALARRADARFIPHEEVEQWARFLGGDRELSKPAAEARADSPAP